MTPAEIQSLVIGVLTGLGASTVFVIAVFAGFCVLVGRTKHRKIGTASLVCAASTIVSGPARATCRRMCPAVPPTS